MLSESPCCILLMQQGFYKTRLTDKFAIDVLIPIDFEQGVIHRVIYQELCLASWTKSPTVNFYMSFKT
jgi:aspartate racemase